MSDAMEVWVAAERDRIKLQEAAPAMRAALQWLLDDMDDAGETRSKTGKLFDSVEYAVVALTEAGGSFHGYTVEDAIAYRKREAADDAADTALFYSEE